MKNNDILFLLYLTACAGGYFLGISMDIKQNEELVDYISFLHSKIRLEIGEPKSDWDDFIDALIEIESGGDDNIVGDGGLAVGCLQIWPITVDDANRIVGYDRFSLDDRYSRERSIEIFDVIQRHYNPDRDLHLALKVWNSRAPLTYHRKVIEIMNQKQKL